MNAPIIWDFDQITDISALPIDEKPLDYHWGRFTTIANKAESKYTYYSRNIAIKRSNVLIDGLEHRITGEADQGCTLRRLPQYPGLRLCNSQEHHPDRPQNLQYHRRGRQTRLHGLLTTFPLTAP